MTSLKQMVVITGYCHLSHTGCNPHLLPALKMSIYVRSKRTQASNPGLWLFHLLLDDWGGDHWLPQIGPRVPWPWHQFLLTWSGWCKIQWLLPFVQWCCFCLFLFLFYTMCSVFFLVFSSSIMLHKPSPVACSFVGCRPSQLRITSRSLQAYSYYYQLTNALCT